MECVKGSIACVNEYIDEGTANSFHETFILIILKLILGHAGHSPRQ